MTSSPQPSLSEIMGTLDELAAATRANDAERYQRALDVAGHQAITDEQIKDAHTWARRDALTPQPSFDWQGQPD